ETDAPAGASEREVVRSGFRVLPTTAEREPPSNVRVVPTGFRVLPTIEPRSRCVPTTRAGASNPVVGSTRYSKPVEVHRVERARARGRVRCTGRPGPGSTLRSGRDWR